MPLTVAGLVTVGSVASTGLGCMGFWIWTGAFRPGRIQFAAHGDLGFWWKVAAWIAFLTLWAIVGLGLNSLLAWMPDSWGWVDKDEDGVPSWTTLRRFLSIAIGLGLAVLSVYAYLVVVEARAHAAIRSRPDQ